MSSASRDLATGATGLRLHIGCGSTVVAGWENLDKSWNVHLARAPRLRRALRQAGILTDQQAQAHFPRGIIRVDVRHGLPYEDGSVSYVYSSHMIEHLSRWRAVDLMRECRRVLVSGGVVRLATPNFATLINGYRSRTVTHGATPADSFMKQLETYREIQGSFAQRWIHRLVFAPHQWLYDAESLSQLVEEASFVEPIVRDFREGTVPDLDYLEHREDSLFLEARSP